MGTLKGSTLSNIGSGPQLSSKIRSISSQLFELKIIPHTPFALVVRGAKMGHLPRPARRRRR